MIKFRFQREQELDYFQRKKFGQLTDRVNKRMEKNHGANRSDLSDQQQQTTALNEPFQ